MIITISALLNKIARKLYYYMCFTILTMFEFWCRAIVYDPNRSILIEKKNFFVLHNIKKRILRLV
jgi:hypothetical protein